MYEISMNFDGVLGQSEITKELLLKGLSLFRKAGITYLDASIGHLCGEYTVGEMMRSDVWIYNFKDALQETGIRVGQTHFPVLQCVRINDGRPEFSFTDEDKLKADLAFRSTSEWGCKRIVIHPQTKLGEMCLYEKDSDVCRNINVEYFKCLLGYAHKYDVTICIETMDKHPEYNYAYCSSPQELKELVEVLDDEKIKYCLDTGHVNVSGNDVADTIRFLGNSIEALHLHDNFGTNDGHCLPPFGSIDWQSVACALREVNYKGTLNFEINGLRMAILDEPAKLAYLKYAYEMGRYLERMILQNNK